MDLPELDRQSYGEKAAEVLKTWTARHKQGKKDGEPEGKQGRSSRAELCGKGVHHDKAEAFYYYYY